MYNLNVRFRTGDRIEQGRINSLNDIINKGYTGFITFEDDSYNSKQPSICFKEHFEAPDAIILTYPIYFGLVEKYLDSKINNDKINNLLELVKKKIDEYNSVKFPAK